jgi:hypothetical protein
MFQIIDATDTRRHRTGSTSPLKGRDQHSGERSENSKHNDQFKSR